MKAKARIFFQFLMLRYVCDREKIALKIDTKNGMVPRLLLQNLCQRLISPQKYQKNAKCPELLLDKRIIFLLNPNMIRNSLNQNFLCASTS